MAVVIRLQGLRITAGFEDIRSFFTGLKIPKGGVYIIGGELEEAFIIFASDEDARHAMSRSGGYIKGSRVTLLLSSRSELQKALEANTKKPEVNSRRMNKDGSRPAEDEPLCFGGKISVERQRAEGNPHQETGNRSLSSGGRSQIRQPGPDGKDDLYLHLHGMPFSATKEDVLKFFDGLRVDDIILLKNGCGLPSGAGIVKFATGQDAAEGLKRDREYIGSRYVCVRPSAENKWFEAGGGMEPAINPTGYGIKSSSTYTSRKRVHDRPKSRSPVAHRSRSSSPSKEEFCVMVENLSYNVEKKDLKDFFHPIPLKDDQIIHINDKYGKRTRAAFVLFTALRDYCAGLSRHKEQLCNKSVNVSPVSKEKMIATLQSMNQELDDQERPSRSAQRSPSPDGGFLGSEVVLKCIARAQMREFGISDWRGFGQNNFSRETGEVRQSSGQERRASFSADEVYMDGLVPPDVRPHGRDMAFGRRVGHDDLQLENPDGFRGRQEGPSNHGFGPSGQKFDDPTRVKLSNLPTQINIDEIYDFCYGYRVIPGSVKLQFDRRGCVQSCTVVFESHREALNAVRELHGRPIGKRKVCVKFV